MAMVFVCISHSSWPLPAGHALVEAGLERVGMIATPMFLLISGTMLGLFYARSHGDVRRFYPKYLDRALFLLLIVHPLLALSATPLLVNWNDGFRSVYITDVLAVCMVVGPALWRFLSARQIFIVAAGSLAAAYLLLHFWHPSAGALVLLRDFLVGRAGLSQSPLAYSSALLPYLSVYLLGSWLGYQIEQTGVQRAARPWMLVSILLLTTASGLWFLAHTELRSLMPRDSADIALFWPFQKLPPGPVYLSLYVGLSVLLGAVVLAMSCHSVARGALASLARVGRTSLFIFVVQNYLYGTFLPLTDAMQLLGWPLAFALSLVVLYPLCRWWDRSGSNSYFTLGIARQLARLRNA